MSFRTLLAVVAMVIPSAVAAAAGQLDATFAAAGIYTPPPETGAHANAHAVAQQSDGKLVVAGQAGDTAQDNVVLTRILENGAIDPGFGVGGFARFAVSNNASRASGVAISADGGIIVAGHYVDDALRNQSFFARLTSAGQLDSTYGDGGIRRITVLPGGAVGSVARALVLQPDGKAVLAGSLDFGDGSTDMFASRVGTDGTIDSGFGVGGVARSALPGADDGYGVALTPSGAVVVAGEFQGSYLAVMQLLPGGSLDPSMSGDGIAILGTQSKARAVAVQSNGKIVVGGTVGSVGALVRFLPSGDLDTAFNATGVASFPEGVSCCAMQVMPGADGYIYTYGYGFFLASPRRFTNEGVFDSFWGSNVSFPATMEVAGLIDSAGRLVAAYGNQEVSSLTPSTQLVVTRILSNASLDPAFGNAGTVVIPAGLQLMRDEYRSLAVSADGRISALGRGACADGSNTCGRLSRLLPEGTPDPALTTSLVIPSVRDPFARFGAIAVQPDGKLLYAQTRDGLTSHTKIWQLARLNADGSADDSFTPALLDGSNDGLGTNTLGWIRLYPDGRILFASSSAVRRLLPDGAIDPGFNLGNAISSAGVLYDGVVLPSGGFLVAGSGLRRYDSDGFVDFSFGSSGSTDVGEPLQGVAVQDDGRIFTVSAPNGVARVRRFTAAGAPDGSFDIPGIVAQRANTSLFSGFIQGLPLVPLSIALQLDGRILVAGTDSSLQPLVRMFVARMGALGSLDASFGTGGLAFVSPSAGVDTAAGLVLSPQGGILLGGSIGGSTASGFPGFAIGHAAIAKLLAGVEVATRALPVGGVGVPYSAGLEARGGIAPYTFTLGGAPLPGLAISGTTLSGTPTTAGDFPFTLTATDAASASASSPLSIRVFSVPTLVDSYYQTILGRAPDASGQAFWTSEASRVSGLGASISEAFYAMAAAFFGSAEYAAQNKSNAQFVNDLYRTFFNRAPDPSGGAYWSGELALGKPRGAVLNDFLFSAEFADFMARIFGSATTSRPEVSMVMDFYRGLLGRLPDTGGFQYWVGRFRSAQCNGTVLSEVETVSSLFVYSAEYANKLSALPANARSSQYVIDLYNAFLKRGGDRPGVQYWIDNLTTGGWDVERVRIAFRNSLEFQNRVQAVVSASCLP